MALAGLIVTVCISGPAFAAGDGGLLPFSGDEIRRILQHGPWPVAAPRDPGNRVSGKSEAVDFGGRLFFDPRLSARGAISCASCHVPERSWTDGLARGVALATVDRNTPSVLNQRLNRWYGLDGANDSLWSQSIRPILDQREFGSSASHVAAVVRNDRDYACRYRKAFGTPPPPDDEALLVDVAKALAAFQETLVSGRTAFDEFRDALERGDRNAAARYPLAAQRGLRIFAGKGNCTICHVGPNFTNGEFHDIGVPFFLAMGKVDAGRYDGIRKLQESRFNLLGRYNDDTARSTATSTRHVLREQRNFGEFRVPSLRNAALTAPYMHNGQYSSLREVVLHYSELNEERLHADGERILKPLNLSEAEVADLVAFLESLTDRNTLWRSRSPQEGSPCH